MKNKVILISIDGTRPDGVQQCNNPYVEELMKTSNYTYSASPLLHYPAIADIMNIPTPREWEGKSIISEA